MVTSFWLSASSLFSFSTLLMTSRRIFFLAFTSRLPQAQHIPYSQSPPPSPTLHSISSHTRLRSVSHGLAAIACVGKGAPGQMRAIQRHGCPRKSLQFTPVVV